MAQFDLEQLAARVEAIHRQYSANFAGQPRATRDLALLKAIIAEIDEALSDASSLSDQEGAHELINALQHNRELYTSEAKKINEVKNDPRAGQQDELMIWLTVITGRYQRYFANQSRASRDLGLLHEIAEDAERIFHRMEAFEEPAMEEALDSLRARKKLYVSEIAAVENARREASAENLAGHLANMANDQFKVYQRYFTGQSRLSRRPARLKRVIGNLTQIHETMSKLQAQGLVNEHNDKNIEIVAQRLQFYGKEIAEIQQAKEKASVGELGTSLAEGANAIFALYQENYAGQSHKECDESQLDSMIEQLYDLARQMEDLQLLANMPENQKNLRIVLNNLRLYEREYASISNAKAG